MNTYNDNLHTSVLDSLRSQELELKDTKSKLNASTFTLYYAEGEVIDANEKLLSEEKVLKYKAKVKVQAVINGNTSGNTLTSSTKEKQLMAISVTNAATAAANVQVAANSILRLASDVGSIFSIVSAADFDTDIYNNCKDVKERMSNTAYSAELASQNAMEASEATASVTATTVDDLTKVSNTSMMNLLQVAESEFDAASTLVNADNAALAAANTKEKVDEGNRDDSFIVAGSIADAYDITNKELNLGLTVPLDLQSSARFTVKFDYFFAPFGIKGTAGEVDYPVEKYEIMVVKSSKKSIFSLSDAENILLLHEDRTTSYDPIVPKSASVILTVEGLLDTDGELVELAKEYVVFVMAVLDTQYKKSINNFEDYLSAPSLGFTLTNQLAAAKTGSIEVTPPKEVGQTLKFSVNASADHNDVEYRCMFLPAGDLVPDNLMTKSDFGKMKESLDEVQSISDKFIPEINDAKMRIIELNSAIDENKFGLKNYQERLDGYNKTLVKLQDEEKDKTAAGQLVKDKIVILKALIIELKAKLLKLEEEFVELEIAKGLDESALKVLVEKHETYVAELKSDNEKRDAKIALKDVADHGVIGLAAEIAELDEEKKPLLLEEAKVVNSVLDLESAIEKLEKDLKNTKDSKVKKLLKLEIKVLKIERDLLAKKVLKLKGKLDALDDKISSLELKLKETEVLVETLTAGIKTLEESIDATNIKIGIDDGLIVLLVEGLEIIDSRLKEVCKDIPRIKEEIEIAKKALKVLEGSEVSHDDVKNQIKAVEEKRAKLEKLHQAQADLIKERTDVKTHATIPDTP